MKISKGKSRKSVFATVSRTDLDQEFENFGEEAADLEDDFPVSESSPKGDFLKHLNRAVDDVQSSIQALVKGATIAKGVSEEAQKATKEIVKDLAVILGELQLVISDNKGEE